MGDKVHHPRHAVATVLGRGRSAHQLDALERLQREVFPIEHGRARDVAAWHANAINRHQHAVAAQAANLDTHVAVPRESGRACAHGQPRRAAAHLGIGQVLQRLAQIATLLVAQAFFADDVRRQGQVVISLFHARAADDDGGQGGMGRRRGDLGLGER